jgi:S-adenosylmethionine:tRNA ribosyltransferase-isomerase
MRTADFDYVLPPELIAQVPTPQRDQSRLLALDRTTGGIEHGHFSDLPKYLHPADVLVFNDSKVIPARLRALNAATGGHFEVFLLDENAVNDWWAMMRPGKRARVGSRVEILDLLKRPTGITARVEEINEEGHRRLVFEGVGNVANQLNSLGEIPLPPYIERTGQREEDRERYQTVYARALGSVAAPTAGLHFTPELLARIRAMGVQTQFVTLHVGPGTFVPVKAETIDEHVMHEERFSVSAETAAAINRVKETGVGRVIAVGTTSMRVLESVARNCDGRMREGEGRTRIFIYPPCQFAIVDALVTNFHLPKSTLLMLASAFASPGTTDGRDVLLKAYAEAIRLRYRFFSYGDAMLIH